MGIAETLRTLLNEDRRGVDDLSDELLAAIFARALPGPDELVTRAALAARHRHLTCRSGAEYFEPMTTEQERAAKNSWREYVTAAEVSDALADHPLFCISQGAEEFYKRSAARGRERCALRRVCKRWDSLLARYTPVRTVVCGLSDRLPLSTEAVILVWDWDCRARKLLKHFLAGLPRLQTLVIWNPRLLRSNPSDMHERRVDRTRLSAPPPLPKRLSLKHLVYVTPAQWQVHGHRVGFRAIDLEVDHTKGDSTFSKSVARMRGLHTLVLPVGGLLTSPFSASHLRRHMPQLRTLVTHQSEDLSFHHLPLSTALRNLDLGAYGNLVVRRHQPFFTSEDIALLTCTAALLFIVYPSVMIVRPNIRDLGCMMFGRPVLVMSAIAAKTLVVGAMYTASVLKTVLRRLVRYIDEDDVSDVSDVDSEDTDDRHPRSVPHEPFPAVPPALQALTLTWAPWRRADAHTSFNGIAELRNLSQLRSLDLNVRHFSYTHAILLQLAEIPLLASLRMDGAPTMHQPVPFQVFRHLTELYIDASVQLEDESLERLSAVTTLQSLAFSAADAGTLSRLTPLSALTALTLTRSELLERDCHDIGTLTLLRVLSFASCRFIDAGALPALSPLAALMDFKLLACDGALLEPLAQLNPGAAFPDLEVLDILYSEIPQIPVKLPMILLFMLHRSLQQVNLCNCMFGSLGLRIVGSLPELKRLDLRCSTGWQTSTLLHLAGPKLLYVDARGAQPWASLEAGGEDEETLTRLMHACRYTVLHDYTTMPRP